MQGGKSLGPLLTGKPWHSTHRHWRSRVLLYWDETLIGNWDTTTTGSR